jgi:hypothetical protein
MFIENVLSKIERNKLVKQPFLKDHSRQMMVLHIPAGMELKPHVSKVDVFWWWKKVRHYLHFGTEMRKKKWRLICMM